MKLSEIILQNEIKNQSLNYDVLHPRLKTLYIYFKDRFNCEPKSLVTDLFNACCYAKIVPSNEFTESICDYLEIEDHEIENNDNHLAEFETINFNSKMMIDLIKN